VLKTAALNFNFEGHEVHFYLKPLNEQPGEVADAVYDVLNDRWVLAPQLDADLDPEKTHRASLASARKVLSQLRLSFGKISEFANYLNRAAENVQNAANPDVVMDFIVHCREELEYEAKRIVDILDDAREARERLHSKIKEKMLDGNTDAARVERHQYAEVLYKEIDRAGYLSKCKALKTIVESEKLLAKEVLHNLAKGNIA
jgi:hypothetical protein